MYSKEKIKSISGFIIAILVSSLFLFSLSYFNYWWLILIIYLIALFFSLLIFCFWLEMQWFIIPFIPVFPLVVWVSLSIQGKIKKILKKNIVKQNVLSKTVVIVTNFNWYDIEFYINTSPTHTDVFWVVKYLLKFRKDFSFYLKPTREDIENIMSDKKVREVYFLGHGNSSEFQMNAIESLKYKEFNNRKFFKDFVHQVHCGTKYGKPLRYYVVSKKNWGRCFFVRKPIAEKYIVEYFKNKINK